MQRTKLSVQGRTRLERTVMYRRQIVVGATSIPLAHNLNIAQPIQYWW